MPLIPGRNAACFVGLCSPTYALEAWKRAMDWVEVIYRVTSVFPAHERYGLASQMLRAAVSIPAT
ncbi:MAG: four helix bundle protein [Thiobacillus sp.]